MNKFLLQQKIDYYQQQITILEREMRELNNKPSQSEKGKKNDND